MKKGLALLTCSFLALPLIVTNNNSYLGKTNFSLKRNAGQTVEWPAFGTVDTSTPFRSRWQGGSYGFKRTGDTEVLINGGSGWGVRCDYGDTKFTRDEFEISLDLTDMPGADVVSIVLGSDWSTYMSEGQSQIVMDVLKSPEPTKPNDYLITLNRGGSLGEQHNSTTIDGWVNNNEPLWLDSYQGAIVTALDNVLTIGFNNVTETTADVYVNEHKVTLPTAELFKTLGKEFYLTLGTGFNAGDKHLKVNHVYGKGDKEYYGTNGAYQNAKNKVNAFVEKAKAIEIKVIDDFVKIYNEGSTISFAGLKNHDIIYLQKTLNPVIDGLKEKAITQFGNDAFVSLYEVSLQSLEGLQNNFDKAEALQEALGKCKEIENLKVAVDGLTLTPEQTAKFNDLVDRYNSILPKINKACGDFYTNSINGAITAMDSATTVIEANAAEKVYASIDRQYASYVEEALKNELETKLTTSRANFKAKFKLSAEDISKFGIATPKETTYISKNATGLEFSSYGGTSTGTEEGDGILFKKEAVDVADFSVTYNVKEFGQYAISLMNKPTYWSNAGDQSIQQHKGLIFLIRNKNETTATVETYLIDGTCNEFFNGQISLNTFDIPKTGDIKLSFKINTVEQSGIFDNYFEFDFNGHKYTTPLIKAFNLLGAFDNGKGYLGIGSQGGTNLERLTLEIKDINGNNPVTSNTIRKNVDYSPKIVGENYSFELETTKNVIIPVNPMLKTISKVMIDETVLTKDDYSYTRNSTLTLKARTLNKLAIGKHTLSIETDGGIAKASINITKKETPQPETPTTPETEKPSTDNKSGLSTGAIAGIIGGSVAGAGLIAGLVWFFIKRKRK